MVEVVHAVAIPLPFEQAMLRAGTPQREIERYRSALIEKAQRDLATFQHSPAGSAVSACHVPPGEPAAVLIGLSRRNEIDLLAIGSHGGGALLPTLIGGVVRRVVEGAACDVLIARES